MYAYPPFAPKAETAIEEPTTSELVAVKVSTTFEKAEYVPADHAAEAKLPPVFVEGIYVSTFVRLPATGFTVAVVTAIKVDPAFTVPVVAVTGLVVYVIVLDDATVTLVPLCPCLLYTSDAADE